MPPAGPGPRARAHAEAGTGGGVRAGAAPGFEPRPAALVLDSGTRFRFTVLNVGLACCAVEAVVASLSLADPVGSVPNAGEDRAVDVLVVSGTVTDKLAPLVRRLYDALPGPVRVLSFGACANTGGPYWDSYCVTQGVDLVVPVDAYVPGCPPRPQALLDALAGLAGGGGLGGSTAADLQRPLVRPGGVVGPEDLRARPVGGGVSQEPGEPGAPPTVATAGEPFRPGERP